MKVPPATGYAPALPRLISRSRRRYFGLRPLIRLRANSSTAASPAQDAMRRSRVSWRALLRNETKLVPPVPVAGLSGSA